MTVPSSIAWALTLVLALAFGSFLNVCVARLPRHESIVQPPSRCPHCGASVRPRDNVPVLGWLLLAGRCRDCGHSISARYPLLEMAYPLLVSASIVRFGFTPEGLAASVFCFLALGLFAMDLETLLLPDAFTLPGLVLGLLWAVLPGLKVGAPLRSLGEAALAAVGWGLVLLAIRWSYYAVRRSHGLGLGDVKLAAMLAAWLGVWRMGVCFLLAVCGAALFGIALAVVRPGIGRLQKSGSLLETEADRAWAVTPAPLGAFLCAGGVYSLFFGEQTLRWYLSFFSY